MDRRREREVLGRSGARVAPLLSKFSFCGSGTCIREESRGRGRFASAQAQRLD